MAHQTRQLGQLLLEEGRVSPAQLEAALAEQRRVGHSLGRVLVDLGILTERELVATLAKQIGMPFVDLSDYTIDPTAASRLPLAMARRHSALPIGYDGGRLLVAMSDPGNVFAVDDVRAVTGMELRPVVATKADVAAAIERVHRSDDDVGEIVASAAEEATVEDLSVVTRIVEDAPIVKLVNLLIQQAVQDRASDIHVEPQERELRIRYRIDGVLHEVMRPPRTIQSGVVSRLKIMADLDIAERRVPQDGRVALTVGGKGIDLRVATLPTVYGEKVVMRILDKSSVLLTLPELGFSPENFERFRAASRKPYGMLLVTGPTGSGKSTTLYATLNSLNDAGRNIVTIEDPVEYRLGGINQVQVNTRAGLTFAAALRSILRCDPDIVLIGEIRDAETARIAVESALTGHLVLATLHTNDAPSAVTRLTEMGLEPFLVASAVDCVLAQRLARRLCDKCREPYRATEEALAEVGWPQGAGSLQPISPDGDPPKLFRPDGDPPKLFRPVGCTACGKTGYRGRLAFHEVMTVTEEIERLCVERRSSNEIAALATAQGMTSLRHDGLAKAALGETAVEEVVRVVV